jgi:membrane protein
MRVSTYWGLFRQSFSEWSDDNAPRLGAALAYYTILSLAPLLIIVIAIVGAVLGRDAAQGQIVEQLKGLIGPEGGKAVETMIRNASQPASGTIAGALGLLTLLFGASGVVTELRSALNTIWDVNAPSSSGIIRMIRERVFSLGMVLAIGFLLLVSLVVSAFLSVVGTYFEGWLPVPPVLLQAVNFVFSLVVITALFSMIYKFLPDIKLQWSDVTIGAAVTAVLFTIGKQLIGMYLGTASVGSAYGAAGSVVVLLVWIYYSAQVFFLGAEFTQVYARSQGSMRSQQPAPQPDSQPSGTASTPKERHARPSPQPESSLVTGVASVTLASVLVGVRLFRARVLGRGSRHA